MAKKLGINTMDKLVLDRKTRLQEIEKESQRLELEKQDLIKKEEIKNIEALKLSNHMNELKEQRDWINSEIIKTQLKLNKLCTHEKISKKESYSSGSYLNKEEYITEWFCDWCGELVDREVKYGGFG